MIRSNSKFVIEPFSSDIPSLNDATADKIPPADSKVWNRVYQHNPIQIHIKYSLKNPEVGISVILQFLTFSLGVVSFRESKKRHYAMAHELGFHVLIWI